VNARSFPGWFWLEPSEALNDEISVSRGPGVKVNTLSVVVTFPTPVPLVVNVKVRVGAVMTIGAALVVSMVTAPFAAMVNVSPSPPLYVIGSPSWTLLPDRGVVVHLPTKHLSRAALGAGVGGEADGAPHAMTKRIIGIVVAAFASIAG
jgi:hypothetical protein